MHDPETLARVVESTGPLMLRYVAGFTDQTRAAQAPGLPNHVIWTLGHLSLYLRRAANRVQGAELGDLSAEDFCTGDGRAGGTQRFDTESVCFGSVPLAAADIYPSLERGLAVFNAANAGMAHAVRRTTPDQLSVETTWGKRTLTGAQLIEHMIFHNATHTGQIVDLRRALGMELII